MPGQGFFICLSFIILVYFEYGEEIEEVEAKEKTQQTPFDFFSKLPSRCPI